MAKWVMGIDVGTTAVKVLALDVTSGRFQSANSNEYPLYSDNPGWAEAEPADWMEGVKLAVSRMVQSLPELRYSLQAIAVCGMVPAVVLLDQRNRPLRRSIQQSDGRTSTEMSRILRAMDGNQIYRHTGSYVNQQHVLPKLMWIRDHEPETWKEIRSVVGSYDYIRGIFTGNYEVEINWAIESGCFDIHEQTWMVQYMEAINIPREWFGTVGEPLNVSGYLLPSIAKELGLSAGIPVMYGSADHVASALAAGVEDAGDTLIKFGGAGDILFCTETPVFHPQLYFDRHDLPNRYLLNGCMAASGSLVRWLLERIKADESMLPALDRQAEQITPGSDGIVVLPYFLGEKTPLFNPQARGVIFGLMLHHTDAHLFRAVLESVIYGFRHHFDVLSEADHSIRQVYATNGGAKSALWLQIAADTLGYPILGYPHHPGSALGAAIVAAMGAGIFPDIPILEALNLHYEAHEPNMANHALYNERYHVYRELYERTKDLLPIPSAI